MSWDRDEMAQLFESIETLVDTLRAGFQSNQGYGTQGTPDPGKRPEGEQQKLEIDLEPIRSFNRALTESVPSIRLFGKSLDATVEKIAETLTAFTTLQGAIRGLGSASGQFGRTGASSAFAGAFFPLTSGMGGSGQFIPFTPQSGPTSAQANRPFVPFTPQQNTQQPNMQAGQMPAWWNQMPPWWNVSPGGQQQPSQPTGQQRRRAARNRRRMRRLSERKTRIRKIGRITEGAIVGGLYGGPRGALFGAGLGLLRGAGPTSLLGPLLTGVGLAAAFSPKVIQEAALAQMEENRQFAAFAPGLMTEFVRRDVNNFFRGVRIARGTAESAIRLTRAEDALEESMVPVRIGLTNVKNEALGFFAERTRGYIAAGREPSGEVRLIDAMIDFFMFQFRGERLPANPQLQEIIDKEKKANKAEAGSIFPMEWTPPKVAPRVRHFN